MKKLHTENDKVASDSIEKESETVMTENIDGTQQA
jgi:hypothetical protein